MPVFNTYNLSALAKQKSKRNSGNNISTVLTVSNKFGFIPQDKQFDKKQVASEDLSNYKIVEHNDFAYNPARINVGSIARMKENTPGIVSPMYIVFTLDQTIVLPEYFELFLKTDKWKQQMHKYLEGSVRQCLQFENLKSIQIELPSIEEQKELVAVMDGIDSQVFNKEKEIELLSKIKLGTLRKIVSEKAMLSINTTWEERPLSDYLFENKKRNKNNAFSKEDVLSVSKDNGVVNQIEYFGKSLAGNDLSNYHCVDKGDIVYTKSPLGSQPYGIIKNSNVDGITSTLYAVYHCKDNVLPEFVNYYFEDDEVLNRYLKPLVNIGAKHDMKVRNDIAISGMVCFPSTIEDQKKIVGLLDKISSLIRKKKDELELLNNIYSGVLQKAIKLGD